MDCYDKAIRKIKHDKKCKPKCLAMIGPTGPTGPTGPSGGATGPTGPTARLVNSSNK